MMDYNAHLIARSEHNLMTRSIPAVSEWGEHLLPARPGYLSRLTALLRKLAARLIAFRRKADETPMLSRLKVN